MKECWLLWMALMVLPGHADAWRVLDGTGYLENQANDGDSFHAKRNTREYLLRLYYVDCPETDSRYPDRVKEQADYFGLTPEQAVKGGKLAAEAVEKKLKGRTLEVHTRYEDARGASNMKRYFAMVRLDDQWLSEWLVENGWARVHGVSRELPDGTSERLYWSRLRKLEREAREAKRGLWGLAAGTLPVQGEGGFTTVKLDRQTPVFSSEPPHRMVGQLPEGWEVELGPQTRTGFREVRFTSPGGHDFTGEIQNLYVPR
jgi:endonuclease YncB( thermonuclease family)